MYVCQPGKWFISVKKVHSSPSPSCEFTCKARVAFPGPGDRLGLLISNVIQKKKKKQSKSVSQDCLLVLQFLWFYSQLIRPFWCQLGLLHHCPQMWELSARLWDPYRALPQIVEHTSPFFWVVRSGLLVVCTHSTFPSSDWISSII